jgi:hypothetical protein
MSLLAMVFGAIACLATDTQTAAGQDVELPIKNRIDRTVVVEIRAVNPYQAGAAQRFTVGANNSAAATLRSPDPFVLHVRDLNGRSGVSEPVDLKKFIQANPQGVLEIVPIFAGPPKGLMANWALRSTPNAEESSESGSLNPPRR